MAETLPPWKEEAPACVVVRSLGDGTQWDQMAVVVRYTDATSLLVTPEQLPIGHGKAATSVIEVSDTGSTPQTNLGLSPRGDIAGWITLERTTIAEIAPGETVPVNVTVAVPRYQAPGDYSGGGRVQCGSQSDAVGVNVRVPEAHAVVLTLTPDSRSVVPGNTGVFVLGVKNEGNVSDGYDLTVDGLPDGWEVSWSRNPVHVEPGARRRRFADHPTGLAPDRARLVRLHRFTYDPVGNLLREDVERDGPGIKDIVFADDFESGDLSGWQGGGRKPGLETFLYAYAEANQLLSVGETTFRHDGNGNRAGAASPDGVEQYAYDSADRLTEYTRLMPQGQSGELREDVRATYAYDGLGRRIEKKVFDNGKPKKTRYLYDAFSFNPVQESADPGHVTRKTAGTVQPATHLPPQPATTPASTPDCSPAPGGAESARMLTKKKRQKKRQATFRSYVQGFSVAGVPGGK